MFPSQAASVICSFPAITWDETAMSLALNDLTQFDDVNEESFPESHSVIHADIKEV
jgi:hypothetical protein